MDNSMQCNIKQHFPYFPQPTWRRFFSSHDDVHANNKKEMIRKFNFLLAASQQQQPQKLPTLLLAKKKKAMSFIYLGNCICCPQNGDD